MSTLTLQHSYQHVCSWFRECKYKQRVGAAKNANASSNRMRVVHLPLRGPSLYHAKVLAEMCRPCPICICHLRLQILTLQCRVSAAHNGLPQVAEAVVRVAAEVGVVGFFGMVLETATLSQIEVVCQFIVGVHETILLFDENTSLLSDVS